MRACYKTSPWVRGSQKFEKVTSESSSVFQGNITNSHYIIILFMENTLAYLQHDRTSFHRQTKILLAATKTLNIKLAASISSKDDQGSNMSNSLERNSCDKLTVMKKRNTNDDCDGKCIALQSFMFMFPLYFIQLSVVQCV